uniref:Uncharacterized protein n=1 Tax=Kalanchoe fedtschenkoi TaxID=63787 RepID=A0A7N0T6Z7_KALFE
MASTAYPEEPTADKFSSLPIMHLKQKIVEKIMENRVTLIVGETGCGTDPLTFLISVFSMLITLTLFF